MYINFQQNHDRVYLISNYREKKLLTQTDGTTDGRKDKRTRTDGKTNVHGRTDTHRRTDGQTSRVTT